MSTNAWDERFRRGDYPQDPAPPTVLERHVGTFPDGEALNVATGTGRLSVFLAEEGYDVVGLDQSRVGLKIARENARDRGVGDRCEWIQTDALEFDYPEVAFDLITVRSFRIYDRLTDLKAALKPGTCSSARITYAPRRASTTGRPRIAASGRTTCCGPVSTSRCCITGSSGSARSATAARARR